MLNSTTVRITLQEAFNSTFHNELKFSRFINDSIEHEEIISKNKLNLFNPSKQLRKYHNFLNNFIFNFAKVDKDVVFSYMEGRTAFDAVQIHSKNKFFFKTDIVSFFDSISKSDVEAILDNNLSNSPISDIQNHKESILNLVTVNRVLPIGFSTSPNISNTFLFNFDAKFKEYCLNNNLQYSRFADDIIVSSMEEFCNKKIELQISNIFIELFSGSIKINKVKTKYLRQGEKIKLLGMVVLNSGGITVDSQMKSELEVLLYYYVTDKDRFDDCLKKYEYKIATISGKLNYINTVDKAYLDKLRRKYGNYVVDGFIHQTIKS